METAIIASLSGRGSRRAWPRMPSSAREPGWGRTGCGAVGICGGATGCRPRTRLRRS